MNPDNHYDIFDDMGASPATPEEWENMCTTHDLVWLGSITAEMTRRVMEDYLHNHKDPNLVSKYMDKFTEAMTVMTGLNQEDIGKAAMMALPIMEHLQYIDDPEGARASKRAAYEESLEQNDDDDDDEPNEELRQMAEEFAQMITERHKRKHMEDMEIRRMEYSLASSEVDSALNELCSILGLNKEEVMPKGNDSAEAEEADSVINKFFGNNN